MTVAQGDITAAQGVAAPLADAALVVDDDHDMCRILELTLANAGCVAISALSAQRAIALAAAHAFPVAFIDARLPDMDGWRLIEELRRLCPAARIIMVSGYYFADDVRVVEAIQAGRIDGFLAKPFLIEAIVAALRHHDGGKRRRNLSGVDARPGRRCLRLDSPKALANC